MGTYERNADNSEIADEIELIQRKLGIGADGTFGAATEKAVKAWQRANGQEPDGMVGPDMLLRLGLVDLLNVENGDEGHLVRQIQNTIGVAADGVFGDNTETALRKYQKANRLKATGTADAKTLQALGLMTSGTAPKAPPVVVAPAPKAAAPQDAPTAPAPTRSSAEQPSVGRAKPSAIGTKGAKIASWAYQLAEIDPKEIAALDVDLVVVDYSADGSDATAFKPADVAAMQSRPDGGRKLVVSYMSIGEAEDYRYY